jgi:hypothetical protein
MNDHPPLWFLLPGGFGRILFRKGEFCCVLTFYPEAIRYLARKYNIEIEETELTDAEKSKYRSKESMYLVSDFAKDYFHHTLLKIRRRQTIGLCTLKNMVLLRNNRKFSRFIGGSYKLA